MKIVIKKPSRAEKELYQTLKTQFETLREDTLDNAEYIDKGNAEVIAMRLRAKEITLAHELIAGLSQVPREPRRDAFLLCQDGDTCVPTSISNGLMLLDQSQFFQGSQRDMHAASNHFIDDFLYREPGHDRSERRSLDRVQHYFANGFQRQLGIKHDYEFELTGSLLDMIYGLYCETATIVLVEKAHALLAYHFYKDREVVMMQLKDPLVMGSKIIDLEGFADRFCWSPLGGLNYAVSLGQTYSAASAKRLITDQAARHNLGVCCHSGILRRLA